MSSTFMDWQVSLTMADPVGCFSPLAPGLFNPPGGHHGRGGQTACLQKASQPKACLPVPGAVLWLWKGAKLHMAGRSDGNEILQLRSLNPELQELMEKPLDPLRVLQPFNWPGGAQWKPIH